MTTAMILAAAAVAAETTMTFTADKVAADRVTGAAVATGHVVAVRTPYSLRSDYLVKTADGLYRFAWPTCATTCTNEVGHTHWNVTGELEYKERDSVVLRDACLRFLEIPIFWLPYFYYPLGTDCGFSWMPGYSSRWGAYLLTKYRYHIAGDEKYSDNTWWLWGATRLDLRYENGIGIGEDLYWNLGDFGHGEFGVYYARDEAAGDRYGRMWAFPLTWGSGTDVGRDRYIYTLKHRWEATERDVVRVRGTYLSDPYFLSDFQRGSFFSLKDRWFSYANSGVFWEHLEDALSVGAEVSGRLNDFYGMTGRLPEFYLDVNPLPLGFLPLTYESQNRVGALRRDFAEYRGGIYSDYGTNPGPWADYSAVRVDTAHRVTAPVNLLEDILSAAPRVGYRGTYWSATGGSDLTGRRPAAEFGEAFRSIGEMGVTFSARGTADVNDEWRHMVEPYLDVLAQEAWYSGIDARSRPYVFDNLDASMTWEDQFAGRGRALPYSYYGITPGLRNAWSTLDERGGVRRVLDVDAYAAAQFNTASLTPGEDLRRLAYPGSPNGAEDHPWFVPGARVRWTPDDDTLMGARIEYESDGNRIPCAGFFARQKLDEDFSFRVRYDLRRHRYWDFASFPRAHHGYAQFHLVELSCEHKVCDWLAWGPMIRWDLNEQELDSVGGWIDYMTDCLGFRFMVEFENDYTTIDGYRWGDDWSFGFYIYLRCFGPDSGDVFSNK